MSPTFTPAAFELLAELADHNDRQWFASHADQYRRLLLEPFEQVLVHASRQLVGIDWPMVGGRRTMARPMRDQRYAKDVPYRTCVRGLLTSTGTTPTEEGCVHLELGLAGGFIGVGFHRPPRRILDPIRDRIIEQSDRWREIRVGLDRSGRELTPERLARLPSGYSTCAGHVHAEDLRLRSLEFSEHLSLDHWLTGAVTERLTAAARDGGPLLSFGNEATIRQRDSAANDADSLRRRPLSRRRPRGPSSVDGECGAGHERAVAPCEEHDERCDVVDGADPTDRVE